MASVSVRGTRVLTSPVSAILSRYRDRDQASQFLFAFGCPLKKVAWRVQKDRQNALQRVRCPSSGDTCDFLLYA